MEIKREGREGVRDHENEIERERERRCEMETERGREIVVLEGEKGEWGDFDILIT